MKCECLEKCPFFNDHLNNMPSMANMLKEKYCLNDFESCARHRVFKSLGKEAVPSYLFPHHTEKADEILKSM